MVLITGGGYNGLCLQQMVVTTDGYYNGWRCSRARALPHYKWRADTFKRVAETGPRLANVVGKGRLSLTDFLPEVQK